MVIASFISVAILQIFSRKPTHGPIKIREVLDDEAGTKYELFENEDGSFTVWETDPDGTSTVWDIAGEKNLSLADIVETSSLLVGNRRANFI